MRRTAWLVAAVTVVLIGAAPALAQGPGGNGSFRFRLGGYFPSGSGEFWDKQSEYFGVDKSDFNDAIFGASWVVPLNNYLEVGFNIDFYDAATRSADEEYVDDVSGALILHDTALRIVPMTVDLRVLPGGRYAQRGKLAARKPVPYLGAGIGMNYWEYEEQGDFVYFDLDGNPFIEYDRYADSGTALAAHVLAGVEIPLSPAWYLTLEGRYTWSKTSTDAYVTSEGYTTDDLDLGGAAFFVGASLQF